MVGGGRVNLTAVEKLLIDLFADEKALKLRDKSKFGDEKLSVFLFIFSFVFVLRLFSGSSISKVSGY
jgi:hypothetical protein